MFSPITERSMKIRMLYVSIYAVLLVGGLTMVMPFLIMITGSLEPAASQASKALFFPTYLVSDDVLWDRYLRVKYADTAEEVRVAWNDKTFTFEGNRLGKPSMENVKLWQEFLKETNPPATDFYLGFIQSGKMPSYSLRKFRLWLLAQYDNSLPALNENLQTNFVKVVAITAPTPKVGGTPLILNPLMNKYFEFIALYPELRIASNAGNFYRNSFLSARYRDIADYNAKYGTQYQSLMEVPFPAEVPAVGADDWTFFVKQVLRPDFIDLTEQGFAAQKIAGLTKDEFIRAKAMPQDFRIKSIDVLYGEWAAKRGITNASIPQKDIDLADFEVNKGFWRWQFPLMNYQRVLDEVLLHGRAFINTFILVALFLIGNLTVNPIAAYALSRFKLKQTYFILVFCLATTAFPAEVTMIPVFLQLKEFNLLNTFGALVLPGLANGFSIFLLKGFFDSLPKELYEAAELDGASEFTMFWQITMNLSKPILAVMALGAFTAAYSTFFYALVLAPDPKMWTIMVYIFQLQNGVDSPVVYASLILVSIPTLLVFIFCQNIILRGIVVPTDK